MEASSPGRLRVSMDESFRSYVSFDVPREYMNDDEKEVDLSLLPEEVLANDCDRVMLYHQFSDNHQGLLGKLFCTDFRVSFVPFFIDSNEVINSRNIFISDRYDIPHTLIEEIFYTASALEGKKFKAMSGLISSLEQVSAIKVFLKDFRVLTFDFSHSQNSVQLTNQLFHFSFPAKLDASHLLPRFVTQISSVKDRCRSFNRKEDWLGELERTGVREQDWRVSLVNSDFRLLDAYPEYLVVPSQILDHLIESAAGNWTKRRFPVWCWASRSGRCLLRCSELNGVSNKTQQQWDWFVKCIQDLHPERRPPLVVDVNYSLQKISQAYAGLRKFCAMDSATQYWLQDDQWYSSLEHSGWMTAVSRSLELSWDVVRAIQSGQSVIIREGEGRDMASVVSSLAQLCLDPYFRTLTGFGELMQKEWFALAHPFALRIRGLSDAGRFDEEKCPVFLLFLDCVSQLSRRYPADFEFSQYYLIALWDLCLLGLTESLSVNSLREAQQSELGCPVWPLSRFYSLEYSSLLGNPLWRGTLLVEGLGSPKTVRRCLQVLEPVFRLPDLEFWLECHLRWAPTAQINQGGEIQRFLRLEQTIREINGLQERVRQLGAVDEELKWRRRPQLPRRPSRGATSSGYPFIRDVIPLPPEASSLSLSTAWSPLRSNSVSSQGTRNSMADFRSSPGVTRVNTSELCFYPPKRSNPSIQELKITNNNDAGVSRKPPPIRSESRIKAKLFPSKVLQPNEESYSTLV